MEKEKGLQIYGDGKAIPGLEDNDRSDMVLPRIKVDCKSGLFINSLDGREDRELEVVLLSRRKGMVCFKEGMDKPDCKSFDRKTGTKYGECEECEKRLWHDDKKPLCKAVYEFLIFGDNQTIPYGLSIHTPTSYGVAKKFTTLFVAQGKPLFSAVTKIGFEKKTNSQGKTYYQVKFTKIRETTPEEMQKYYQIMQTFRDRPTEEETVEPFHKEEDLPY